MYNSIYQKVGEVHLYMKKINEDIKNNTYKTVYLLYGEEEYLKKQYKNKFIDAICNGDTMNYSYYEGKGIDVKELIGTADTLPFFAERRLIVVENSGFFKSSNEELATYFSNENESTCVVFIEGEVDKRNKLFKTVNTKGYVCELGVQNQSTLESWIAAIVKKNDKTISKPAIMKLLDAVGSDMVNISTELEKLIAYTYGRASIEVEDIDAVCSVSISAKVFDMVDALSAHNRSRAVEIYKDLIALKEPPMRILFMIMRQFNIMLMVSELKEKGTDYKEIASRAGLQPFIVTKVIKQLGNFSKETLKEALDYGLQLEEDFKNGRIGENVAVEMLLIKYS